MTPTLRYIAAKAATAKDWSELNAILVKYGWNWLAKGSWKNVFWRTGADHVLKTLSISSNGEDLLERETEGAFPWLAEFRLKSEVLRGENYIVVIQEKVSPWNSLPLEIQKRREKEAVRIIRRIEELDIKNRTGYLWADTHSGNYGLTKEGKIVFFDGL